MDALFFHQPADKIEIGFPVLHTIVALPVGTRQAVLDIAKAQLLEDPLDDIRSFLVLENPAIGSAGQKPEPRSE